VARWQLRLFDSFSLTRGARQIPLRIREQRTVALLAMRGSRPRSYLAGVLWPDSTERRASGSLRAAVWRLERAAPGLLLHDRTRLALAEGVDVDVAELLDSVARPGNGVRTPDSGIDVDIRLPEVLLSGELLPGWYDDWITYERARIQQVRLRRLDAVTEALIDRGQYATALTSAMAAQSIEPLRESAQRAVIRIHLAEGNYHEALREYRAFRARLVRELGVAPSAQLDALVQPLLAARQRATSASVTSRPSGSRSASAQRGPSVPAQSQRRATASVHGQHSGAARVSSRRPGVRVQLPS
jgi:DNA-binding SARP family transcriptional activator